MSTATLTPQASFPVATGQTIYLSSPEALSSRRVSVFTFTAQLGDTRQQFNLMVRYGCASKPEMTRMVRELTGQKWAIVSDLKLEGSGF
jgi:hypothetical protein